MIFESFPWKQDLRRRKNLIIKYNTAEHFEKNDDTTYTVIEKAIFYSAFIIRKLIDCGGKLSDESENYSLKVCSVQPLKPVDRLHRWPEEDSHDWENEKEVVVTGKNVCNCFQQRRRQLFGRFGVLQPLGNVVAGRLHVLDGGSFIAYPHFSTPNILYTSSSE